MSKKNIANDFDVSKLKPEIEGVRKNSRRAEAKSMG
jgi:hypothetical protein